LPGEWIVTADDVDSLADHSISFVVRKSILQENPRAGMSEPPVTPDSDKVARKEEKKARKKATKEADARQRMMGARRRK
jgi:hypothetical protein